VEMGILFWKWQDYSFSRRCQAPAVFPQQAQNRGFSRGQI